MCFYKAEQYAAFSLARIFDLAKVLRVMRSGIQLGLFYLLFVSSMAQGLDLTRMCSNEAGLQTEPRSVSMHASLALWMISWCDFLLTPTSMVAMVVGLAIPILYHWLEYGSWPWLVGKRGRLDPPLRAIDSASWAQGCEAGARGYIAQGRHDLAAILYASAGRWYSEMRHCMLAGFCYSDAASAHRAVGNRLAAERMDRLAAQQYRIAADVQHAKRAYGLAALGYSFAAEAYVAGGDRLNAVLCYTHAARAFETDGSQVEADLAARHASHTRASLGAVV